MKREKSSRPRTYPVENEKKLKETINKLRSENKRLRKEVKESNNTIKELQRILEKDFDHIQELTDALTVEEVIRLSKKQRPIKVKETKETVRNKYKKMFSKEEE